MSAEDVLDSRNIRDSLEWDLLYQLHHFCSEHCRAGNQKRQFSAVNGSIELENAVRLVDIQIRSALTATKLQVLLYLESEDDAHMISEPEMNGAGGDVSPQGDGEVSSLHSSRTPVQEALFRMQQLCSALEARVNCRLLPTMSSHKDQHQSYPRLTQLLKRIQSWPSTTRLVYIPHTGSNEINFLFNIADDAATAKAFIACTDTRHKPGKDTIERMIRSARTWRMDLLSYSDFVDGHAWSLGLLNDIGTDSCQYVGYDLSPAALSVVHKFREQRESACRAILSHVNSCKNQLAKHKILLRSPEWDEIGSFKSIQLFSQLCASHHDWQAAVMFFAIPYGLATWSPSFCEALQISHISGFDLEVYGLDECETIGHGQLQVQVPKSDNETQRYGNNVPSPESRFEDYVHRGRFTRDKFNLDLLMQARKSFDAKQRRALAIKLVLGLMVALGSKIESWNPGSIHLVESVEAEHIPFISISDGSESPGHQCPLSSGQMAPESVSGVGHAILQPLYPFTLLAKALLQVTTGERITSEIPESPEGEFLKAWRLLRRSVEERSKNVASGVHVSRDELPLLTAALGCLDFHKNFNFQIHDRGNKPLNKIDIMWKVAYDTILRQIDNTLCLDGMIKRATGLTGRRDHQQPPRTAKIRKLNTTSTSTQSQENDEPVVDDHTRKSGSLSPPVGRLFDGTTATNSSTAEDFWECLSTFHRSYVDHVNARRLNNGEESPRRIRVAILDTGLDLKNSILQKARQAKRIKQEWCHSWVGNGNDFGDDDDELHGTNCAHLLHKAAPEADIYVGKVFRQNSLLLSEAENIAKAITHATDKWKVDIISMSFGLRRPEAYVDDKSSAQAYDTMIETLEEAIEEATSKNCLIFAAASNSGKNEPRAFPASCGSVFCVHASEGNGTKAPINPIPSHGFNFMTLGMGLDLMKKDWITKGERSVCKNKSVVMSGTSFATPIAAGIAATVLDLSNRVKHIDARARKGLRKPAGMEKMLRLMSSPNSDYHYLAPWHHWKRQWQDNRDLTQKVWSEINLLFLIK